MTGEIAFAPTVSQIVELEPSLVGPSAQWLHDLRSKLVETEEVDQMCAGARPVRIVAVYTGRIRTLHMFLVFERRVVAQAVVPAVTLEAERELRFIEIDEIVEGILPLEDGLVVRSVRTKGCCGSRRGLLVGIMTVVSVDAAGGRERGDQTHDPRVRPHRGDRME